MWLLPSKSVNKVNPWDVSSLLALVTRESRFLNFSMATLERANLGGVNMHIVRGGHSWKLGSIASLARETTGEEILVAVWPKHGLRSNLRVPNLKIFPEGACPQTPLACTHLKRTLIPHLNGRTRASSGWRYSVRTSSYAFTCRKGRVNPKIFECALRASGWTFLSIFLDLPLNGTRITRLFLLWLSWYKYCYLQRVRHIF